MIWALGLLLSVSVATAGGAPATPVARTLGKDVDCQKGYFALTAKLVSGGHYIQAPDTSEKLYTTFFAPDDHTIWRFTLEGNPAHPAVAVLNTGPKGISLKGACGYGDGRALDRFVTDFEIAQMRRGK